MPSSLSNLFRVWKIARTLARHDALFPAEYMALMPARVRFLRRVLGSGRVKDGTTPGYRLARALESLGPAHIKLGQVLATRPDLVGADVATELEGLQDRLPAFPSADARAVVEREFNKPLDKLFIRFGEPVAAASISQVHEAETSEDPPKRVAVKVLRPGIEEEFARDLSTLAFAARLAERFSAEARRLRLTALIETLADSTALELDLRMEAAAASELAERMEGDSQFRVPQVDWARSSSRVLTTEWIDGVPLRDIEALKAVGHDPKKIALIVMRTFLTQALREGFFHADMHPGNLFVDRQGRLVAVDYGIMGRLDVATRRFMAETIGGFLARDYLRVARAHFEQQFVPSHFPIETFAQALRAVGEPIFGRPARDVSMAKLLQQLFDTTRRFEMQAQPQLLLLQKTMVVVEGVARALDPDFDIWEASRPVVEAFMLDSLSPKAKLKDIGETVSALAKSAQRLPDFIRNVELIAAKLTGEGLRVAPQRERNESGERATLILLGIAAAAAAAALLVRVL
ncbi:ubiquinone biosynthesis protein [Rhizomicrobium palustre]|uniref:Ubiquinone biosynthesis protein n=1 Tax=Rhizomicrobium palustre TaxID=189966 RepID=A0A846N4D8_9PROT|nr:2-polyprenylphenol 6-hydroxylase [Rhizomicrobium palustre]NIK90379.1 ubiquinone biosynthesis protein [Rhizomicrobium palustre]